MEILLMPEVGWEFDLVWRVFAVPVYDTASLKIVIHPTRLVRLIELTDKTRETIC